MNNEYLPAKIELTIDQIIDECKEDKNISGDLVDKFEAQGYTCTQNKMFTYFSRTQENKTELFFPNGIYDINGTYQFKLPKKIAGQVEAIINKLEKGKKEYNKKFDQSDLFPAVGGFTGVLAGGIAGLLVAGPVGSIVLGAALGFTGLLTGGAFELSYLTHNYKSLNKTRSKYSKKLENYLHYHTHKLSDENFHPEIIKSALGYSNRKY